MNKLQTLTRNIIQSIITNTILLGVTCDDVQIGWVKQTVFILAGIDTKIGTDSSSPAPTLFRFPNVTHVTE